MKAARLTLVVIVLALVGWRLMRPSEAHSAEQSPAQVPPPQSTAPIAPERDVPHAAVGPDTRGRIPDEPNDAPDASATQRHFEDVYGKDRLDEAGATQIALYSSRAHHQWLSIGSTLHHAGNKALAAEVASFIGLLKRTMQPFTAVSLTELLESERHLLAKVREPRVLKLPLRGGGGSSIGAGVDRIERGNRAASQGGGPSVAEKIAEIAEEAAAKEALEQADRKPWRSWSSDPDELQEEIADRRMPRPIDEQGKAHGLEDPGSAPEWIVDAAIPEP